MAHFSRPAALPHDASRRACPDPSPHRREPARLLRLVTAGAEVYRRDLVLPRLLPVGPDDLSGPEPATGRRLCALIARALRAERCRGRAGHWSYDLNRHIGLAQALKAERAALAERRRPPLPPSTRIDVAPSPL
jgi:hypothetical protein